MSDFGHQARLIAVDVLKSVFFNKRYLKDSLERSFHIVELNKRDRAFVRNLTTTTLRRLGQIDDLILYCLKKPFQKKNSLKQVLLRIGVCQLLFLNTSDYAAISTTVDLAEKLNCTAYKKFINAILRRLQREGRALLDRQDSVRLNTPDWLWESWVGAYGATRARKIAEANMMEAPLDISYKNENSDQLKIMDSIQMPGGAYRLVHSGDVRTLFGFEQGFWWVQDAASRLAITLSGNVFGKDVIDLCAAPGGKTFYLVCNGANVTAVDRSEKRIKRLDENLKRLGMKADTVCADSLTWLPKKRADLVLLDAPCSGTGTLRRNPDIAYLKSPQDLKRLVTLQTKLFDAAAKMIKPEGRILFCTCSLQPEEGPEQVRMFLERHPEFKLDRVSANEVFVNTNPSGIFRSFPYDLPEHGGRDGFFAARLCR